MLNSSPSSEQNSSQPTPASAAAPKSRTAPFLAGLALFGLVAVTSVSFKPADAAASNERAQDSPVVRPTSFGVPISDLVFGANLRLPNQKTAQVYTREGTLASFSEDGRNWIALSPQRNEEGTVDWAGVRIDRENAAVSLLNRDDIIVLAGQREDSESLFSIDGSEKATISVHLYDIGERIFRHEAPESPFDMDKNELNRQFGGGTSSTCCVSCGQTTLCSTASVKLSCGSCEVAQEIVTFDVGQRSANAQPAP